MSKTDQPKGGVPLYKLTYFNMRWLAEPIRLILTYAEQPFEDKRVEEEGWAKIKKDYPYGKVPLLEFEGKKLSQSFAIARYLAKKHGLIGADDFEAAKCDEYVDTIKDVLKETDGMWTDDDSTKLKVKNNFLDKVVYFFTKIEDDLKTNANGGKFLVGNKLTWADLELASFTEVFESFVDGGLLDNYPRIKTHQKHVFSIPRIKEWIAKRPVTEY